MASDDVGVDPGVLGVIDDGLGMSGELLEDGDERSPSPERDSGRANWLFILEKSPFSPKAAVDAAWSADATPCVAGPGSCCCGLAAETFSLFVGGRRG